MADRILIIGASGRAAAFSALRAGLTPTVIDLFGDDDLRAVAESHVIAMSDYPNKLVDIARTIGPMPWMYTGALENYPDVIRRIAAERELIGNGPAALAQVRNPFGLATALSNAGFARPQVSRTKSGSLTWHRKPDGRSGHYFQEFIFGESQAAIFKNGQLLGVTRQLVGEPWLHAPRWQYCGSVGPLVVSEFERRTWEALGAFLVEWAGLRGLFGVDAIVRDGVPWPVEVNPRYTASVEVLEYSRILARPLAKAVYYAPHPVTISDNEPWSRQCIQHSAVPAFADIPPTGSIIAAGRPVLTIFGRDEQELRAKALMLDTRFANVAEPVGSEGRR